ncbi:phage/plasmid primase, P4 family [Amaricoccus sp. W119]|uniref:phage/plasmid primase, P4 family n=1 Tax=Amaricoccus sp. W119 TaxID=3391833 RepID=UPI0039A47406
MNAEANIPPRPGYRLERDLPNSGALAGLKPLRGWMTWDYDWSGTRWTKPPRSGHTGNRAGSTDEAAWATYYVARETQARRGLAGVGFSLDADPDLIGIDLDHCLDVEGQPEDWVSEILDLAETYAEVSPSDRGLRLLARGTIPAAIKCDPAKVEIYASGRYLTLTAKHVAGTPNEIRPAPKTLAKLIARAEAAKQKSGEKKADQNKPGTGGDFFTNVKSAALAHLDRWVPALFPRAAFQPGTGAWRVTSLNLARNLEEDLSFAPTGIKDWGRERGMTALDVVMEFGGAGTPRDAALWLCEKMGIAPASFGYAERNEPRRPRERQATNSADLAELTEDGVALAFTARFQNSLRFDHDAGRWYEWSGDRWRTDTTNLAFSWCREVARNLSDGAEFKTQAAVRKRAFAAGVEAFARADRAHAVNQDCWDRDPFLLGCPGGAVDLRNGAVLPARPDTGITKHAAVAPSPRADCPLWLQFLLEATQNDADMVEFLQRWCGYCLTGDTREHALIFLYGPGGNGKSVFLNTVAGLMGDYATVASMDTFTATRGDKHPTELAMLRGARMVSASETEEGRAWAESRIKAMTGGDPITARFMRQDFFTYQPEFKLTIVGNHAPALVNVDDAARRRFNIVPFTVKPKNPDRELEAKLRAEWPGILRWMIEGAVAWQRSGLAQPESVRAATAEYFGEQDFTAQWLEETCTVEPGNPHRWENTADLFASWSAFAKAAGEEAGSQRGIAARLRRNGLRDHARKIDGKTYRGWSGVTINRKGADHHD